jgi:hypothetical protein
MDINSDTYPFSYIVYETDKQGADTSFITGEFWSEPEYLENKWHVPIVANTITSQEFLGDSAIVGHWMKVTIKYEQQVNSYIKQILTNFNISFA